MLSTVEITGNEHAVMNYKSFEKDIVLRYGIKLEGWTHKSFAQPKELPSAIEPLRKLLDAMEKGSCHFVKLTANEWAQRQKEYDEKLSKGAVRPRKKRSDAGGTHASRKRKGGNDDLEGESQVNDVDNGAASNESHKRARPSDPEGDCEPEAIDA